MNKKRSESVLTSHLLLHFNCMIYMNVKYLYFIQIMLRILGTKYNNSASQILLLNSNKN
jgi:hypothetical protein